MNVLAKVKAREPLSLEEIEQATSLVREGLLRVVHAPHGLTSFDLTDEGRASLEGVGVRVVTALHSSFVRSPDGAFTSFRLLTEKDGMGFTVCKTVIPKGGPWNWHYTRHQEACYCIQGHGVIKDLETGVEQHVGPDAMYVLANHENHTFEAFTDVILISVFNPPLRGDECHKEDGSYE